LDKLAIYAGLGVREVWYWRKGKITPYVLRGDRYEAVAVSEVLPGMDLAQLARFIEGPTMGDCIRDYQTALRSGGPRESST
ncbi:MAG: Uma2 family endonuclease, partial [Polyangiaceae bacterium]|nr:Uma2 family endonuclease [Polyangiaceae bacterium]